MTGRVRVAILLGILVVGWAPAALPFTGDTVLPEGTRISLRLNDYLGTKLSREGDAFTAEVIEEVRLADRVVIPKGSMVRGTVSRVIRPGRFRGKAMMNVLFHTITIPGKGPLSVVASLATVDSDVQAEVRSESTVEADASKGEDVARVAKPAAAGAGIGVLVAGGKGAAIGSGVGAVIGLATVFSTRGKDIEVRRGATLDIVLDRPLPVPGPTQGLAAKTP